MEDRGSTHGYWTSLPAGAYWAKETACFNYEHSGGVRHLVPVVWYHLVLCPGELLDARLRQGHWDL